MTNEREKGPWSSKLLEKEMEIFRRVLEKIREKLKNRKCGGRQGMNQEIEWLGPLWFLYLMWWEISLSVSIRIQWVSNFYEIRTPFEMTRWRARWFRQYLTQAAAFLFFCASVRGATKDKTTGLNVVLSNIVMKGRWKMMRESDKQWINNRNSSYWYRLIP